MSAKFAVQQWKTQEKERILWQDLTNFNTEISIILPQWRMLFLKFNEMFSDFIAPEFLKSGGHRETHTHKIVLTMRNILYVWSGVKAVLHVYILGLTLA